MRRTLYIIFASVIISSCNSENRLDGTWIGAYSYSPNNTTSSLPIRQIITFNNCQYTADGFKYDFDKRKELGKFKISSKKLILNEKLKYQKEIESINSDSIVFKGEMGSMNQVYKKVNPLLKENRNSKIDLIGKVFLITSDSYKDTIYFKNDTVLIKKSDITREPGNRWERIKHNGFDLIFMELNVPFIIQKQKDSIIYATEYYKEKAEFKLKELNKNVW